MKFYKVIDADLFDELMKMMLHNEKVKSSAIKYGKKLGFEGVGINDDYFVLFPKRDKKTKAIALPPGEWTKADKSGDCFKPKAVKQNAAVSEEMRKIRTSLFKRHQFETLVNYKPEVLHDDHGFVMYYASFGRFTVDGFHIIIFGLNDKVKEYKAPQTVKRISDIEYETILTTSVGQKKDKSKKGKK